MQYVLALLGTLPCEARKRLVEVEAEIQELRAEEALWGGVETINVVVLKATEHVFL